MTLLVVNVVVTIGMVAIVPLGLRLVDGLTPLARWWPAAGSVGAVALWLPRGAVAATLASGYALATVGLAAQAPVRVWRKRTLTAGEVAVLAALVTPLVAGVALVAERAAHPLFGFTLPVLALTVAHFHFAGFAAALVAGLACRTAGDPLPGRLASWSVPGGTGLVLAGYFVGEWLELAGAVVLSAGMWLVAWLAWRQAPAAPDRVTRALLVVSAAVLVATMALALQWAWGEATGTPHLPLATMAATHGVGNALGFALSGLLAWQRLRERPL